MIKRIFKLFKNNDVATAPEASTEGYLEQLLDHVRPRVVTALEQCPEHDPLLLVALEIVRELVPRAGQGVYASPLRDMQTATWNARTPPPAPEAHAFDPEDETCELGRVADEAEAREVVDEDDVILEAIDDPAHMGQVLAPASEPRAAFVVDTAEITDEFSAFPGPMAEKTGDYVVQPGLLPAHEPQGAFRLDTAQVMMAARGLLELLVANDQLPLDQQLKARELSMAQNIWFGLIAQDKALYDSAEQLLHLVESRFSQGAFGQARMLLRLFQTDTATLMSNDRNLFYEDWILRMGIRRRTSLGREAIEPVRQALKAAKAGDDASLRHALAALTDHMGVHLHTATRPLAAVSAWTPVAQLCARPSACQHLRENIPPRQWRALERRTHQTVVGQLVEHIDAQAVRDHVCKLLKANFFVLRASGHTGMEPYIDHFCNWSLKAWKVDATVLLPSIYQRAMANDELMERIFLEATDALYGSPWSGFVGEITPARFESALVAQLHQWAEDDLSDVAPGNYDLGAFVMDALLGMSYPGASFAFRVHRLT